MKLKRLHFLLITLVLTIIGSIWEQGTILQWKIESLSFAVWLAFIIEISMITVEINESFFRYRRPKIIWDRITALKRLLIKRRINASLDQENQRETQKQLLMLAIENLKSDDLERKVAGLGHLYELGKDGNQICEKKIYMILIEAQRRESNLKFTAMLIDAICDFHKSCRNL
jgi:hypothetical protein